MLSSSKSDYSTKIKIHNKNIFWSIGCFACEIGLRLVQK